MIVLFEDNAIFIYNPDLINDKYYIQTRLWHISISHGIRSVFFYSSILYLGHIHLIK